MSEYSQEAWNLVKFSPIFVFFAMSAADGELNSGEMEALLEILTQEREYNSELMESVVTELSQGFEQVTVELDAIPDLLASVAEIVEQNEEDEEAAFAFKVDLLNFALEFSDADGEELSDEENDAFEMIADSLGISQEELEELFAGEDDEE
jgi:uncharacterized tellurite resistance protein B-like protein